MPEPILDSKEVHRVTETAEKNHAQFYEEQRIEKLKQQAEASTIPPQAGQLSLPLAIPLHGDLTPLYRVLGTLLRRVDVVHANQELIWELEGRTDPRFIRRFG